jgi:subtilisin family serine protease
MGEDGLKTLHWVFGLALAVAWPALAGDHFGTLDPRLYRQWLVNRQSASDSALQKVDGGTVGFIANGRFPASALEERGGRVRWQRGDLAIVIAPVERLIDLAATPGLTYLEAVSTARPVTDVSIPEIGGVKARTTTGLSGRNVLIGIVDSGIDWRHEDFLDPNGKTRIRAILDFSVPGGYYGGTLFTANQIDAALAGGMDLTTRDYSGHGTHVAGIAAGDGGTGSEPGTYAGLAPAAGLIIVKATRDPFVSEFSSEDQLLAIDFIDSVATAAGMPCVINLSYGTTFGPHDGTSAVERFIDSISGPGRVVVAAAGNEGDKNSHAQVSPAASNATISFTLSAYSSLPGNNNDYLLLDGWYEGSSQVSVSLITPANETIGPIAYGRYYDKNTTSGYVMIWNGFYENGGEVISGPNPYNRDKEVIIEISDAAGTLPASGKWQLKLSGSSELIDFWIASETMPVQFGDGASIRSTVTAPATGKSVIAVGAYTTREVWTDIDGNNLTLDTKGTIKIGDVTEFSGAGPSRDGRLKPDLTAPGRIIGSSLSADADPMTSYSVFASTSASYPNAFILPDGVHGLSLGTSMAAPHVSGTVALLLEKKSDLSAALVKQVINSTARAVSGSSKANQWGNGKLNAYAAVTASLDSLPDDSGETLFLPWPNPFTISTAIAYDLDGSTGGGQIPEISVYNAIGQRVPALLYHESISSGRNLVRWYGQNTSMQRLAAGVYFFVLQYQNRKIVRKLCLL